MNIVAHIIEDARRTAEAQAPNILEAAAFIVRDCLLTIILGHTAPELRKTTIDYTADLSGDRAVTIFSLPPRYADAQQAAYCNALALCWYELDPGFRHVGCHTSLHVLPTLLAASEARHATIGQLLTQFVFCYEVVTRIAMAWDTRPSGLHSHAVFSHLGAATAICAASGEDDATIESALNLASSMVNLGQSWEVSDGGTLRNLWPATAAANAFFLYRAGKTGVSTAADRLEHSFGELFKRRDSEELGSRFAGPALLQTYTKLFPACRHLHAAIEASLRVAKRARSRNEHNIEAVEVAVHPEAATLVAFEGVSLLNAQFSLPIVIAIALLSGRFDVLTLDSMRREPSVMHLAGQIKVTVADRRDYPEDRGAEIRVTFGGGWHTSERVDVLDGDPAGGIGYDTMFERKRQIVSDALAPQQRDEFRCTLTRLSEGLKNMDTPLSLVLGRAGS